MGIYRNRYGSATQLLACITGKKTITNDLQAKWSDRNKTPQITGKLYKVIDLLTWISDDSTEATAMMPPVASRQPFEKLLASRVD